MQFNSMEALIVMKNFFGKIMTVGTTLLATAATGFAAIAPADMALVTTAVQDATVDFYKLGGVILAVIAGIWAFYKVVSLLSKKG